MAGFPQYILRIIEDAAMYCVQILFPDSPFCIYVAGSFITAILKFTI